MLPTHTQSPRDPSFVQNPYPVYAEMRALGPLFHWTDYGMPATAHYDVIDAILRDRRFGREVPAGERAARAGHLAPFYRIDDNSMLEREPPVHTRLRGLVLRAFTSRRIAALEPEITALAHELIDRFEGPTLDLLPAFAEKLPVIVIARLLGVPEARADDLLAWSHAMVAMYQSRRDRAIEDAAVAATLAFSDYIRDLIADRRAVPRDDLITHLIAARDDQDRLSEDELIATCIQLLNAGHEATVHTIGNGVKALLEAGARPGDPAITTEEILRFDPPLHIFQRIAMEAVEVHGHAFAPGDRIALILGAAGRDPAYRRDPDVFCTASGQPKHLAFGAGIHFCLGAPLARLELQTALPILFERCRLSLAEPPVYADRYHFRALEKLLVNA